MDKNQQTRSNGRVSRYQPGDYFMSSKPKLFVFGIALVLLLAGCSRSGTAGTWVTTYGPESSYAGMWLVISSDGTVSRDGAGATVERGNEGLCLYFRPGACNLIEVDGDQMIIDWFGQEVEFYRVDPDTLETPDPQHELVGQWEIVDTGMTVDFLPTGELAIGRDRHHWGVDGDIYCQASESLDRIELPPVWQDRCMKIEIAGIYAEIGDDTLRRVSPLQ